jgi:nucleoside-diphosphate-sugar epimerase
LATPTLLLTGGTGFIGSYIARMLAASGMPFRALVRPGSDLGDLGKLADHCSIVEGDLTDPESLLDALEGIDRVVHAAAVVSYQSGAADRMMTVNAGGTANLVNMMLEAGCRRLVYLSSVAALNRVDGGRAVTLEDRWPLEKLTTAYARSKFAAEREVWRGQAEGLSVATLYPAIVLGAGDWSGSNTPAIWRRVSQERRIYPRGSAGFVDVRDVARAVLATLDRDIDRDRFLLCSANLSWKGLLTDIARSLDLRPPSYGMPAWQSAIFWPLSTGLARLTGAAPLITRESHRNLQARYQYDGSHYPETTGLAYVPLEHTVADTSAAFQMSQSLGSGQPPTYLPLLGVQS